jgi:Pup-ligase protein
VVGHPEYATPDYGSALDLVVHDKASERILERLLEDAGQRHRAAHDLPLSAPQVAQADLAYHDIHRGRGRYYQLQRSTAVDRAARDIDIFEAKTVPSAPGRYRQAG